MLPVVTHSEVDLIELKGEFKRGRPLFRVEKDIQVFLFGQLVHTIRKGFKTDKTSWPRLLTVLLGWTPFVRKWERDPYRKYEFPSVLHDDLLENTTYPKWAVDWLYKGALRSKNVSALESALFGGAVRLKRSR